MKPGIPRLAVLALLGEGFFSRLSFGLISLALPLYARHLGLSLTEVGLLVSLSAAINIFGKPFMGALADRFGLKRTLLTGIALRSVITLLFAVCWLPWQLFGIRALHGVAQSVRGPAVDALLAQAGGKKAAASVFAWYSTARALAASLGRASAGLLLAISAGQFAPVFIVACALSLIPLVVVWRFVREPEHEPPKPAPAAVAASKEAPAASRTSLFPVVSLGALMSGTAEMLRGIFPILATEYAGLSPAQTGMIYLASSLVTMAAGPVFGWLSDHVSRELVLMVRSAANILSSALYLVAPDFLGVITGRLVDDAGKAAFRPAWGAMMAAASADDPKRRAQRMGLLGMGEDIGELAGPVVAGMLLASGGLVALMGTRIVLAIATEGYAVFVLRRLQADAGGATADPPARTASDGVPGGPGALRPPAVASRPAGE